MSGETTPPVAVTIDDGVATVTLQRPDRLNALNIELAEAIADAAAEASASDAEVVVLTGAGRAFTAGGDVFAMAAAEDRPVFVDRLLEAANRAMLAVAAIPQPVVARVNGAVAGAGIGILLACDVVVAVDTATFTPAYGAIGLTPDCGVTALLARAIGDRRARDLLLTGRRIDARTAVEWGLLTRLAAEGGLDAAVAETVSAIRAAGPLAPTATKALLAAGGAYAERLQREREEIVRLSGSDFAGARIGAFARRG